MTTAYFTNISIFQKIKQFFDHRGNQYQCHYEGHGIWHVYEEDGDAWVMMGAVRCGGGFKASCETIYDAYKGNRVKKTTTYRCNIKRKTHEQTMDEAILHLFGWGPQ